MTPTRRTSATIVVLAVLLSGCTSTVVPAANSSDKPGGASPTVIALIDSGVNVYHRDFQTTSGAVGDFAATHHIPLVRVVGSGSYEESVERDSAFWSGIELERLYAFEGTRLLSISFGADEGEPLILDYLDHGTGTAYLAAREDPDALIVMIQALPRLCDPGADCVFDPSLVKAMEWAANQSWIDVISVSINIPGNPPTPRAGYSEVDAYVAASRLAADQGKIIVNSGGNELGPPLLSPFAGPPWVIAVGGIETMNRGDVPTSARFNDVVANESEFLPLGHELEARDWNAGTSFSAPIVAGTLARAITIVRQERGHTGGISDGFLVTWAGNAPGLRADAFRGALNASATYFQATDWDPTEMPRGFPRDLLYPTVPIGIPAAQMGWGAVNASLAPTIAELVAGRATPVTSTDKQIAEVIQEQIIKAREDQWAS